MINVAHDTKMIMGKLALIQDDVGRNPRGRSFTFGEILRGTRRTRKRTRGKSRGKMRETLNQHEYGHTCARSKEHKEIHGLNPTKDDTSGGSSSPRGGLESTRDLPVKGS